MSQSTLELLKTFSQATGVTGYQRDNGIHELIVATFTPHADTVTQDRVGSVVCRKNGGQTADSRRKVMLAAHLDEIGAIVTQIDQGFLRFTQVGGLDDRVLMGQEVTVHGPTELLGIIGSIPPHLSSKADRSRVDLREMVIDVGLPADKLTQSVRVGDLVSFNSHATELLNGLLATKAMDNRASVVTMLCCLQNLSRMQHAWDVYAVATADEEWGSYTGATTQAYNIRPDVAIVLDVTFADVPELDVKLNHGPVITIGPSNHPAIGKRLFDICTELELKHQQEVASSGAGTDAFAIEVSREGIPTMLVSIPSRYMHTPVETVHPKDVERTGRLLAHFIAGLDESFIAELTPSLPDASPASTEEK